MYHYTQNKDYTCGPACARMSLRDMEIEMSEFDLESLLGTKEDIGTAPKWFFKLEDICDVITGEVGNVKSFVPLFDNFWKIILGVTVYNEPHYIVLWGINQDSVVVSDPLENKISTMTIDELNKIWIKCFEGKQYDKTFIGLRRK